jgi:hypothetical protein
VWHCAYPSCSTVAHPPCDNKATCHSASAKALYELIGAHSDGGRSTTLAVWEPCSFGQTTNTLKVALMGVRQKGHSACLAFFSFSAHASHTH